MLTPVLLFVNADASDVIAASSAVPGAVLQFHGDETAAQCAALAERCGRPYWRTARIPVGQEQNFDLIKFAHSHASAQALLLDALVDGFGGGGKTFDWSLLPPSVPAHLVLAGGLTPANVGAGLAQLRGRGLSLAVDVASGVESAKGIKDAGKIRAFIAAVRAADAAA
jgi:phosphoribosylanthranilate isomerase